MRVYTDKYGGVRWLHLHPIHNKIRHCARKICSNQYIESWSWL